MLDPLYQAIGWLLSLFYGLVPNLGIAIILLTITVMLVLFPLTAKQAKSMLAMQQLQPELKKLQAKHKGDRQKLNEEMMKLYQEHKVNPLGGCLPLLAQMPIFISLFQVLRNPYKWVPVDSKLFDAFCAPTTTADACGDAPNLPKHLEFLGIDLSLQATDAHGSLGAAIPYFVLVGLVVLTGFAQSRQSQRTTPPGANPQMQMITKVLPVMFGFFSLYFPAGLVLYFLVSNLWRLGQQEWIFRNIHLPHRERLATKDKGDDLGGKTRAPEPAPEPVTPPAPEPERTSTPSPPRPASGGLRSLFRLPPVPDGDGETEGRPAPNPPAREARPAAEATPGPRAQSRPSGGGRSGQGRRRNKKKRKR